MGVYLKWFNQTLKNYYSTNEMKLSGGVQIFKITPHVILRSRGLKMSILFHPVFLNGHSKFKVN